MQGPPARLTSQKHWDLARPLQIRSLLRRFHFRQRIPMYPCCPGSSWQPEPTISLFKKPPQEAQAMAFGMVRRPRRSPQRRRSQPTVSIGLMVQFKPMLRQRHSAKVLQHILTTTSPAPPFRNLPRLGYFCLAGEVLIGATGETALLCSNNGSSTSGQCISEQCTPAKRTSRLLRSIVEYFKNSSSGIDASCANSVITGYCRFAKKP